MPLDVPIPPTQAQVTDDALASLKRQHATDLADIRLMVERLQVDPAATQAIDARLMALHTLVQSTELPFGTRTDAPVGTRPDTV